MLNMVLLLLSCTLIFNPLKVWAMGNNQNNQIQYENIADDPQSGLQFSRATGWDFASWPNGKLPFLDFVLPEELAGIAVFDYDNDGDLDIFISNGIGVAHSLFQNQLEQTGDLEFIDQAVNAGFSDPTAVNHKGSGVCIGDINNDGCTDLLINGHIAANLLYINNCDGTFTYTPFNGIDATPSSRSSSCTFGDINNDGYIDVFIANSGNVDNPVLMSQFAFGPNAYSLNAPNELYLNNGDGTFTDISSSILGTRFSFGDDPETVYDGNNTLTWATTMVDVNNDGYLDIIEINDQFGPIVSPTTRPRGVNQLYYGQGDGTFVNKPFGFIGSWMGIAQGDLNCDGDIDLFVSNFGSYAREVISSVPGPSFSLNYPTRWFFQDTSLNGNFDPNSNDIFNFDFVSPFGWGSAIFDYDNDGDYDVLVHGGLDAGTGTIADNPGTIWQNNDGCFQDVERLDPFETGIFEIDDYCVARTGFAGCTYHTSRNVWGTAIGDLDNDGFYDIITTAPAVVDLTRDEFANGAYLLEPKNDPPSGFDLTAIAFPPYLTLNGIPPNLEWEWLGFEPAPGDLFVEISSGNNKNGYIKITAKGSKDICLIDGNVNRDGIGAILNVGKMTQAVTGGESMISSHSFEKIFGLGKKNDADLTIRWPKPAAQGGGYNTNKLDKIKDGESLTIYEIPCDFETRLVDYSAYEFCVERSLNALYFQELISKELKRDFERSMLKK